MMGQSKELHILSLGAGVQSSTLAFMAAKGLITPMPDAAIFADTQAEPKGVYEYLDYVEQRVPFPVYRVSAGSLTDAQVTLTQSKDGRAPYLRNLVPAFTLNPDGSTSMLLRKCTGDYKLQPIRAKTRALWLQAGKPKLVQWVGISRDEAGRMKPSGVKYITNRWPLIEMGMMRHNCIDWLEANGYQLPPKSACTYCPYHNDAQWQHLKDSDPEAFEAAAVFEERWNEVAAMDQRPSQIRGVIRLHRSLIPLRDVTFHGRDKNQPNLFNNECEGLCGV